MSNINGVEKEKERSGPHRDAVLNRKNITGAWRPSVRTLDLRLRESWGVSPQVPAFPLNAPRRASLNIWLRSLGPGNLRPSGIAVALLGAQKHDGKEPVRGDRLTVEHRSEERESARASGG